MDINQTKVAVRLLLRLLQLVLRVSIHTVKNIHLIAKDSKGSKGSKESKGSTIIIIHVSNNRINTIIKNKECKECIIIYNISNNNIISNNIKVGIKAIRTKLRMLILVNNKVE